MDKKTTESPLIDGALLQDEQTEQTDFDPNDGKAERAADVLREILYHMDIETDVNIRENGEQVVLDVDGPRRRTSDRKEGAKPGCTPVPREQDRQSLPQKPPPHCRRLRRLP